MVEARQRTVYRTKADAEADGWVQAQHARGAVDDSGSHFFGYRYKLPHIGVESTTIQLTEERNQLGDPGAFLAMFRAEDVVRNEAKAREPRFALLLTNSYANHVVFEYGQMTRRNPAALDAADLREWVGDALVDRRSKNLGDWHTELPGGDEAVTVEEIEADGVTKVLFAEDVVAAVGRACRELGIEL